MNDTPRTSALLRTILDRDGQVGTGLSNAPEEWVTLCRELERELAAVTTERDAATRKLEELERSIADLNHPNIRMVLTERDRLAALNLRLTAPKNS